MKVYDIGIRPRVYKIAIPGMEVLSLGILGLWWLSAYMESIIFSLIMLLFFYALFITTIVFIRACYVQDRLVSEINRKQRRNWIVGDICIGLLSVAAWVNFILMIIRR